MITFKEFNQVLNSKILNIVINDNSKPKKIYFFTKKVLTIANSFSIIER